MDIAILNARVSRTVTMAKVDGRSAFGRLIRQVRSDLIQHVGGKPTAVQRMLIERAATLTGYLARLDGDVTRRRARKPNILVIMGDDVGWFNIGAYHRHHVR